MLSLTTPRGIRASPQSGPVLSAPTDGSRVSRGPALGLLRRSRCTRPPRSGMLLAVLFLLPPLLLGRAAPAHAGVQQLSSDPRDNSNLQINRAGQVVWRYERVLYLCNGATIQQLSQNRCRVRAQPKINDVG